MIKALIEVGSDDPLYSLWEDIVVAAHNPNSLDGPGGRPRHLESIISGMNFLDRARVTAMFMPKDVETFGCREAAGQRIDILQKPYAAKGHLPYYFRKGVDPEKEIKTFAMPIFLSTPDSYEHILLLMHTRADRRFITDPRILEQRINEALGFNHVTDHRLSVYSRGQITKNFDGWVQEKTGFEKGEINPVSMQGIKLRVMHVVDPCLKKGVAFTNAGSRSWSVRIGRSDKYFGAIQQDTFSKEQQRLNGGMGMFKPFLWLEISERSKQPGHGWDIPFTR